MENYEVAARQYTDVIDHLFIDNKFLLRRFLSQQVDHFSIDRNSLVIILYAVLW